MYCNHFENEKEEEEEEEDNTSTKELYDSIVICKKNLMIGYFDNCVKIVYSNIDKEEINQINQICENHKKENEKLNNLFIVTYSHNYFSLKQSQVNEPAIQIDRHYNDEDRILLLADESDKARIRKFIYQVSTHIDHSLFSKIDKVEDISRFSCTLFSMQND